jgi:hypothetical protein
MLRPTGKPLQLSETDKGVQPRDLHEEVVLNGVHQSAWLCASMLCASTVLAVMSTTKHVITHSSLSFFAKKP